MKQLVLILVIMALLVSPAVAETVKTSNERHYAHSVTVHDKTRDHYEKYDVGAFHDLVLYQTKDKNIELISRNTWELNRDQYTSLIGAKVNVWSIFKPKTQTP